MQRHELTKSTGIRKARRIARGSTRGKTSGRGHKGQKSRAGHKIRPQLRDEIKRLPKRRGHGKNRSRTINANRVQPIAVNLAVLEKVFAAGDRVTPATLREKRCIRTGSGSATVKILGMGTLTKKLTVADCAVSATAKSAIEKAGGEVL